MVSISIVGARIQDVNHDYQSSLPEINDWLKKGDMSNSNTYKDLWEWHGKVTEVSLHINLGELLLKKCLPP